MAMSSSNITADSIDVGMYRQKILSSGGHGFVNPFIVFGLVQLLKCIQCFGKSLAYLSIVNIPP